MNENELEIQYFYCLENKCPVATPKVRSLAKMVNKGIGFIPEKFTDLDGFVTIFFSYVKNKREDIYRDDVESYLAWRIWHFKLSNIARYVVNPVCKCKAHLVSKADLIELHKTATRIKKYTIKSEELANLSEDEIVKEELKKQTQLLVEIKEASLKVCEAMLDAHKLVITEINQLIGQKIKETPLLGE